MNCEYPNCSEQAEEILYLVINDKKQAAWGNVCKKHSGVSLLDIVLDHAVLQINDKYSIDSTANSFNNIGTMSEKI